MRFALPQAPLTIVIRKDALKVTSETAADIDSDEEMEIGLSWIAKTALEGS